MELAANSWLLVRNGVLALGVFLGRLALVLVPAVPHLVLSALRRLRGGARTPPGLLAPVPPRARPPGGKPRVLFICGTLNHTTQLQQIAAELPDFDHAYTWYYCDGALELIRRAGMVRNTALGDRLRARCLTHLQRHGLPIDLGGARGDYDLAVTCSDLTIPKNVRGRPVVLVQEGMTDREDVIFRLVRALRLPPWMSTTSSTTGLSHAYARFCVASAGYRALFARKGVRPEALVITGIPNFDDCRRYLDNDFPHRGYVLVCSSDIRETARWENRPRFIAEAVAIAAGRPIIWKLHPNENVRRARAELAHLAPQAAVYENGNTEEMIANCTVLVTQFSSTAYVGLALGKEVHSYFDIEELRRLCPVQNGRTSARRIADVCRDLLGLPHPFARDLGAAEWPAVKAAASG